MKTDSATPPEDHHNHSIRSGGMNLNAVAIDWSVISNEHHLSKISEDDKTHINMKGVLAAASMNILWSICPMWLGLLYKYTDINAFEIVYWKALFMNIANLFLCKYYYLIIPYKGKLEDQLPADVISVPPDWRLLWVLRAVFGSFSLCWYFASWMTSLSISKANILFFTGPLYVPMLAYFFIGENISKIDSFALLLGFIGIVIINNPFNSGESEADAIYGGILAALGGAFASLAWTTMRKMGGKVHFTVAPFYFSLGCTITSTILFLINVQGRSIQATYTWFSVFLIGVISLFTFIGQLLQSLAYEYEKASRVAIFYYLQTALVYIFDFLIFSTVFGTSEIIGTILIIGWNFIVAILKFWGYLE